MNEFDKWYTRAQDALKTAESFDNLKAKEKKLREARGLTTRLVYEKYEGAEQLKEDILQHAELFGIKLD